MKKIVLIVLVLVVLCGSVFAFDLLSYPPPLSGGNILIDVGTGYYYTGWSSLGTFGIPPLFVNAEYALPVEYPISVGAGVSFFQWKLKEFYYDYTLMAITPQARASWHWGFDVSWLDLYTGLSLGYSIISVNWGENPGGLYSAAGTSGLYWGAHVGAHFFFTKNIGAVVESGYPFLIKGGVALKFGG